MTFQPFFLAGAPKSGTTWLCKLLDAHPEIACRGEACVHAFTKPLIRVCNDYNALLERRAALLGQPGRIDYPTEVKRLRVLADQARQMAERWEQPLSRCG